MAMAALPWTGLAESGFRVSPETGLELGNKASPANGGKKERKPEAVGEKKPTEILCSKETTFDGKTRIAVFVGDVKVTDPQFNLVCQKLTAYLKKEAGPEKAAAKSGTAGAISSPAPSPVAKAEGKPKGDNKSEASGLDRAVAEGEVVITQDKMDPNSGEVTHYVGRGAKADYNSATGDMVLTGWPQIQQGLNNQVATEEGTIMIMNREGHLRTQGRSKTILQSDSDKSDKNDKNKAETANKP